MARGTKKLPVTALQNIHQLCIDKFARENETNYSNLNNGDLKKTEFNKLVSKAVYPKYQDVSWFTRFETGLKKADDLEAKYWSFSDFNQPILEHLYFYVYGLKLDGDRITYINMEYNINQIWVESHFFYDLVHKQKNIGIKYISGDLEWLLNDLENIVDSLEKNNITLKCLVVSPIAFQNNLIIRSRLKKKNSKFLIIKQAYDNINIFHKQRTLDVEGTLFPLLSDIFIYKNIDDYHKEKFDLQSEILISGISNFQINKPINLFEHVSKDKTKITYTNIWFDEVWDILK